MRQILTGVVVSLLGASSLGANCGCSDYFGFDMGSGWRNDEVTWEIATPGTHHRAVSELRWEKVHSTELWGALRYENPYHYYFRAEGDYSWIYEGCMRDVDYRRHCHEREHHRCDEDEDEDCSRDKLFVTKSKVNKGYCYDACGGMGYSFHYLVNRVIISPLIGYSFKLQMFHMNHLHITFNRIDGVLGPVPGLDSTYEAWWKGPFFGVDLFFRMTECLWFMGTAEYHWSARYFAKGHWNLRPDFDNSTFKQHSLGQGEVYTAAVIYHFAEDWFLGITGTYRFWWGRDGEDKVFIDGVKFCSELHDLRWFSISAMAQLSFRY